MLIDGRLLPFGSTLRADVVVVGAGPAGIACAETLAAAHLHVVLLESAGRTHARADDDSLDGDGSGTPFPLVKSRHRGFGGTSTHWTPETGLRVRPLDGIDFVARAGRPVEPFPYPAETLAPYYDRAHGLIGLEPGYEPERWFGPESPSPLSWAGGPELAMYQFAPYDTFVKRYDDVCANPCIDVTLHSTVDQLELAEDASSVARVSVVCRGGNRFGVTARTVVLAGGCIENSRILLMSPGRDGRGVGNEHDNVGRYFMDHLSVDTGALVPAAGVDIRPAAFREQRSGGSAHQAMLWLGPDRIERAQLPSAAFWINSIDPLYLSGGVSAVRNVRAAFHGRPRRVGWGQVAPMLRGVPDVARFAMHRVRRPKGASRVLAMRILIEQTPDRDSRIRLSDRRDDLGLRRVDLDWRVRDDDLDAIRRHQDLLDEVLSARGIAAVVDRFDPRTHASPVMSNFHHLGGARMHVDPRHGVVDAEGRVHTTSNLYAVGGSMFPAGGYLNPTLTIIALAMKTADAIVREWRTVRVSPSESRPG